MLRLRRIASPFLIAAAAVCLLVGGISVYLDRTVFDSRPFAERATHALEDETVRRNLTETLANAVLEAEPDLVAGRAVIESGAEAVVDTAAFQGLFRSAVHDLHRAIFRRKRDTFALKVTDAALLVIEALRAFSPGVADRVPEDVQAELLSVSEEDGIDALADIARVGEENRRVAIGFSFAALALFALGLVAALDRREAVRRTGIAVAAAGAVAVVLFQVGRAALPSLVGGVADPDVARRVWDAFLLDLRTWSLVAVAAGLTVAAAASALLRPIDLEEPAEAAWRALVRVPERRWVRAVRAAGLVLLGAFFIAARDTVLELAVIGAGAALLYAGVSEILFLSLPARHARTEEEAELDFDEILDGLEAAGRRMRARARRAHLRLRRLRREPEVIVAAVIVALVAAGAVTVAVLSDEEERAPIAIEACNGFEQLCDRRLDEVALAATHNSMSSAEARGWLFPQQDDGMPDQLDAGVRALLIDTHYGVRTRRGVYTVLDRGTKSREKLEASLGDEFVGTAERLRERIGYRGGGDRRVYLCHAFCELGALDAVSGLEEVRDWLVAHPHEVLVISVEDGTAPEDTARVFEEAGLGEYLYRGPARPPYPTLRHMIERGERVVVMAESQTGDVPWLIQQFDVTQETPFLFKTREALAAADSCRLNRGRADAPFLLVNHWVDTSPAPRPSNAKRTNAFGFLSSRVERCRRERRRLPNLVAVDFYRRGALLRVVETLNGV